jgi:hypothetical protein
LAGGGCTRGGRGPATSAHACMVGWILEAGRLSQGLPHIFHERKQIMLMKTGKTKVLMALAVLGSLAAGAEPAEAASCQGQNRCNTAFVQATGGFLLVNATAQRAPMRVIIRNRNGIRHRDFQGGRALNVRVQARATSFFRCEVSALRGGRVTCNII